MVPRVRINAHAARTICCYGKRRRRGGCSDAAVPKALGLRCRHPGTADGESEYARRSRRQACSRHLQRLSRVSGAGHPPARSLAGRVRAHALHPRAPSAAPWATRQGLSNGPAPAGHDGGPCLLPGAGSGAIAVARILAGTRRHPDWLRAAHPGDGRHATDASSVQPVD